MQFSLNDLYFTNVTDKRRHGLLLYEHIGTELANLAETKKYVQRLDQLAKTLHHSMESLVMFTLCSKCGEQVEGGCCSDFMAGETDAIQLLMNMLMDIKIEVQRQDVLECCYLGDKGCIFTLKPFFCLNYNCSDILKGNTITALKPYIQATGQLLSEQNRMEEYILTYLRRQEILTH